MAESPIPFRRRDQTPADEFDAYLRVIDAREAARPRRPRRLWPSWPQTLFALAIGSVFWGTILAGLSRALFGWP